MKTIRIMENNRLAYYREPASAEYWDDVWKDLINDKMFDLAGQGKFFSRWPFLEKAFQTYLAKNGLILEAGCGLGHIVANLNAKGYQSEGVEWGAETVNAIQALYPNFPIRVDDVIQLDVQDGHYAAYLSFGVIEHRQDGPEPFLTEAFRILCPGGIGIITVPYLNLPRRIKARLGYFRGQSQGLEFYQYAYSESELRQLMETAGFEVLDRAPYDGFKGTKDELPFILHLFNWRFIGWRLKRFVNRSLWVENHCAHMLGLVVRKPLTED